MANIIFTSLDYHYEVDYWNPVVDTQDDEYALSSMERDYILSYREIWEQLSTL